MTEVQKILTCLADCLHDNQISEDECLGALKALRGIPAEKHMDAFMAFIGADQEQQEPEEQPENYLAVKTFDSSEFHVGDEIESDITGDRIVVLKNSESGNGNRIYCMFSDGSAGILDKYKYRRTGRNFPAIAAIMAEIGK